MHIHHPRPGDTVASCSPTISFGGVGVVDGASFIANQWSSRRNGKHAKDYFAASKSVSIEKNQLCAEIPRLTEPARLQPSWPVGAAFSPAVQSAIDAVVQSMIDISALVTQAGHGPTREEFLSLAQQAVSSANKIFNEEHALSWSDGFVGSMEAREKDLAASELVTRNNCIDSFAVGGISLFGTKGLSLSSRTS